MKNKEKKSGCLLFVLIAVLIFVLILVGVIIAAYYFLSEIKKAQPGDYFITDNEPEPVIECQSNDCLEEGFKSCSHVKGDIKIEDLAYLEIESIGKSGSSCVIFGRVKELINSDIPNSIVKGLSLECLIPEDVYTKGLQEVGNYLNNNLTTSCKGPLFDVADKFNINLDEL